MVIPRIPWLVGVVAAQRLAELLLSARNTREALRRGGREVGRGHYRWMVALHGAFLLACAAEHAWRLRRGDAPKVRLGPLAVAVLASALRYWAIGTLGSRWTTRVLVVPGEPPVTRGPYRWLRHPNYLAVVLEMASVPLVYGCWRTALVFSALNAWLLSVRIPLEERALGREYREAFADKPRLVPFHARGDELRRGP